MQHVWGLRHALFLSLTPTARHDAADSPTTSPFMRTDSSLRAARTQAGPNLC